MLSWVTIARVRGGTRKSGCPTFGSTVRNITAHNQINHFRRIAASQSSTSIMLMFCECIPTSAISARRYCFRQRQHMFMKPTHLAARSTTQSHRFTSRYVASNTYKGIINLNSYYQLQRSFASNVNGSNDNPSGNSQDIVNSTTATTEWKRNHYRKISDKFEIDTTGSKTSIETYPEPIQIDNYEDVQPMWKEMESRVTRRRSLTLDQRGGVSGRRNVRRSDEDVWLEAGVYDGERPDEG